MTFLYLELEIRMLLNVGPDRGWRMVNTKCCHVYIATHQISKGGADLTKSFHV